MADQPVIKNRAPLGDLDVPLLRRIVAFGEEVEVKVEHAENLLPQLCNWEAVNDAAKAIVKRLGLDQHGDAQSAPGIPDPSLVETLAVDPAVETPVPAPSAPVPSSPASTPAPDASTSAAPTTDADKGGANA